MIEELEHRGTDWRLLYLGRSRDRMPYLAELLERFGSHVYAWPSGERGRYDLDDVWARMPAGDSVVYACGPEVLLSALEDSARRHGAEDRVVVERFAARAVEHGPDRPIEVVLARSGRTITVAEHVSVLDAVNAAGADCSPPAARAPAAPARPGSWTASPSTATPCSAWRSGSRTSR